MLPGLESDSEGPWLIPCSTFLALLSTLGDNPEHLTRSSSWEPMGEAPKLKQKQFPWPDHFMVSSYFLVPPPCGAISVILPIFLTVMGHKEASDIPEMLWYPGWSGWLVMGILGKVAFSLVYVSGRPPAPPPPTLHSPSPTATPQQT